MKSGARHLFTSHLEIQKLVNQQGRHIRGLRDGDERRTILHAPPDPANPPRMETFQILHVDLSDCPWAEATLSRLTQNKYTFGKE